MCNNKKKMHPRNIFRTPPDYTDLAIKYKDFRQVCKLELNGKVSVDYKNENALRTLTQMLLLEYFQLHVDFAPGSLIPTLTLRLNYILWIEDLVGQLKASKVQGIDIGCGSSSIYSLLAAKKNLWHMLALESNKQNLEYAQKNVETNNMQHLIQLFCQRNKEVIFKDYFEENKKSTSFHFCLCNPPFFDSTLSNPFQSKTRNPDKRPPPHNCHTGHAEELACKGGEVEFVQRIIEESLLYSQNIRIFTSMLGHKSSLNKIIDIFKSHDITNFCSTEFHQGNTTRWGIAWSPVNDAVKLAA